MNQTDADRLALLAVGSFTKRGLSVDTWAEIMLELDVEPMLVEAAIKRIRRRTDEPPVMATLLAELRTSSSSAPPRREYRDAVSIGDALAHLEVMDSDAAATLARYRRRPTEETIEP